MTKIQNSKFIIFTDGGVIGNPGPAAIAAVFKDAEGNTIKKISKSIGEKTNNQAEYEAIILALKEAKKFKAKELVFFMDSELVFKQLTGSYKIKDEKIQPLFLEIWNRKIDFKKVTFNLVPREQNREADKLVKREFKQFNSNHLTLFC